MEKQEEELKTVLEDLKESLFYTQPTDTRRRINTLQKKLEHGEALLCGLQTQDPSLPVITYESELASLRNDFERVSHKSRKHFDHHQSQPSYEEDDDFEAYPDSERAQLLKNTDTLHRTSGKLHQAHQVSAHTDETAVNIMNELEDQKKTLFRTRNRLSDIDHEARRSNVLIATIACKAIQNRIILIAIIVMEVFVLFGVLFYKLYHKFNK